MANKNIRHGKSVPDVPLWFWGEYDNIFSLTVQNLTQSFQSVHRNRLVVL